MSFSTAEFDIVDLLASLTVGFNKFILVYWLVINLSYLILLLLAARLLLRFLQRTFFSDYSRIRQSPLTMPISLLVPAHNERHGIVESVRSLLRLNYPQFEIVVINDGSTDDTLAELAREFDLRPFSAPLRQQLPSRRIRGLYSSLQHRNLIVIDKEQGGKHDALNAGLNISRYPLFCSIDADSIIEEDALVRLVKPFVDTPEETIAAGGIVRVVNGCEVRDGRITSIRLPRNALAVMQVLDYLRAFLAGRSGWSSLRSLLIISGAFGLFRKQEVIEVGGYAASTDTEDAELVVRLHQAMCLKGRKYRIVFVPDPVCWTEVPESWRVLIRQRLRWHRGLTQTLWRYRHMMFRRKFGAVGMVAMPWFVFFELLGPLIETMGYIAIPLAWMLGILDTASLVMFLIVAFFAGMLLSVGAILLEELAFRRYPRWRDLLRLVGYGVMENFGFRQVLTFIRVKALFEALFNYRAWGKMERRGFRNGPNPSVPNTVLEPGKSGGATSAPAGSTRP